MRPRVTASCAAMRPSAQDISAATAQTAANFSFAGSEIARGPLPRPASHRGQRAPARLPRIFTTAAPWDALLARISTGGESEVVVDPELLGEVAEVPRRVWRAE